MRAPEKIRKAVAGLRGQVRMFRELWGTVPADCRVALVEEFVFNPRALERRYHEERAFRDRMDSRWNRER
ncbi:MAG TPA: hypothetical protein VD862_01620 [Candidatus Paceibacterota bacterium]|nr:hypothetical protein [Candidatus Paceibacterota bacterium]